MAMGCDGFTLEVFADDAPHSQLKKQLASRSFRTCWTKVGQTQRGVGG